MATAAIAWKASEQDEPEELSEPAKIETWEVDSASARLSASAAEELVKEIQHAREVLEEPGCQETQLYSHETLGRAEGFLRIHIEWLWRSCGISASIPMIGSGPDGSVDLYWKQPTWELLVNIPASGRGTFYGETYGLEKNKGSFDPGKLSTNVAAWLMQ